MRFIALTFIGSFFLLSNGCDKQDKMREVVIVKDCTGTYLRINDLDYKVCNLPMTETYSDGDTILAQYELIEECSHENQPEMVCMMYHGYESWVTIESIAE